MARLRIEFVDRLDSDNPHERITRVGGTMPNGEIWCALQEDVVGLIEERENTYFVQSEVDITRVAEVIVAISATNHKYLRTLADNDQTDNLLSLAACPHAALNTPQDESV